ncbi:hypothetical protein GCM10023143_02850 [Compostibacter hankyongensis]|uniref:Tetratricopeptide repeat protein n=1 Tax=Compostibacter hankyongensis TaxID=1007089 RepID=A0ABP8FDL7_9BACT
MVGAAVLLLAGLYAFGRRVPEGKAAAPAAGPMMAADNTPAADFPTLLAAAKKPLSPEMQLNLSRLETVIRGDVKNQQINAYRALAQTWDSLNQAPIAAHYLGEAAKLENSGKSLTFAANLFLTHLQHTEDPSVQKWEAGEAGTLLKQALELDPSNDSIKTALGKSYIAGGQVMQGVQQLLAVTDKDPDNLEANLILGKLAITSGQYDKAVKRLEGVVALHPDNAEALYFLAEGYKGQGNKAQAVATFERCKKLVNNPDFSKEIDDYIKSF